MKSSRVAELLSQDFIEEHTRRSNIKYGTAIYERGAVHLIERSDARIEAWVGGLDGQVIDGGGSRRRVEFTVSNGTLKWHCTGNPKDHQIFCKHCVALALALLKQ